MGVGCTPMPLPCFFKPTQKMRKTYGVYGKLEYVAAIKAGRTTVTVPFRGGTMTPYGTTPAEFTTDNAMFQAVIEGSPEYASGLITTIAEYPEEEDAKAEAEPEKQVVKVSGREEAAQWMNAHYGIPLRDLRSIAGLAKAASEKGIEFEGAF